MSRSFTAGEKVYRGASLGATYTIKLIDGDSALIEGFGNQYIEKLSNLRSVVYKNSDGWYTFNDLPGRAYYVEWRDFSTPVLKWAFDFNTQLPEEAPQIGHFNPLSVLSTDEFKPVRLTTTQRIS